jgi:hypothetical protein
MVGIGDYVKNTAIGELVIPGGCGPIYSEGRELLRRIFVTVRDEEWREITPTEWRSETNASGSTCTLFGRHTSERVDFRWQGTLTVSADRRRLKFAMQGRSLREMRVCRLGLVVLHPVEVTVAAQLTALGPQGTQHFTPSRQIHPQAIVNGLPSAMTEPFTELTIARADFGTLRLHLTGELFELEDQRNWGDASFKTYCTPLRLGFPRALPRGAEISQSMEMSYEPAAVGAAAQDQGISTHIEAVSDSLSPKRSTQVGIVLPVGSQAPARPGPVAAWDHLHVELTEAKAAQTAYLLGVSFAMARLEVVLAIGDGIGIAAPIRNALTQFKPQIDRVLLRDTHNPLPGREALAEARRTLKACGLSSVPVFILPNGYFVELNRGRLDGLQADGIAFPFSATVHAEDDSTIFENIESLPDMVSTARRLAGVDDIAICPLALYYPSRQGRFPKDLTLPWVSRLIARGAAAGAASITLGTDVVETLWSVS